MAEVEPNRRRRDRHVLDAQRLIARGRLHIAVPGNQGGQPMAASHATHLRSARTGVAVLVFLPLLAACAGQLARVPELANEPTVTPNQSKTAAPEVLTDLDGVIAFERDSDVFVIGESGGTPTAIFDTPRTEGQFVWSPDGTAALFNSNRDDFSDTELYLIDETGVRRLTDGPGGVGGGSWSPDGSHIVYGRAEGERFSLRVMATDGPEDRELFHDPAAWVGNPDWSPDGETIIFGLDRGGGGQIDTYRINADGTGLVQLTSVAGDDAGARWSPDGASIAFWSDREGGAIYVMDRDGGDERPVHNDELDLDTAAIAWSPDGNRLAWTGKYEGGGGSPIFMMNANGSDLIQIHERLQLRSSIDWHPGAE
jgi:Tol biopolymer transport system component